jgi:hypothetical protein
MSSTRTLAVLLAGGMAVSGLAAAPAVHAAAHAGAAPAPTATPLKATLRVTSGATTSRGGIVTVTGSGFTANEAVTLSLSGIAATVTAKADAKGLLPATGFSIPYSTATGTHTIMATGQTSKRAASATVTVQQLTPSISLSATTETQGAAETVTGKGFGPQEQVTLALNGEAISTTAPITTNNGAFSATFTVPRSLLRGVNTISAIGNESRVSAVTALTGNLPRATQFYMSGGLNTAAESTNIDIINTNAQPASVNLIFYYANSSEINKKVTVPAHSTQRYVASVLGLPQGTFGVQVRADRQVAAELVIARYNHTDGDNLPGSPGLSTQWYLAAGSTNGGTETVSVLNADPVRAAQVQLQFLGVTGRAPKTETVMVPAHTNSVFTINTIVPNQGVSVVALSDVPVLVERTQTFGMNADGLTTRAGATTPATEWLFAAGTTANGVRTIYTVLNPGNVAATVTASFYAQNGGALGSRTLSVGPRSRATINLGDTVQGDTIAAVVTSNQGVVVERAEYTGSYATAKSGSVVFGRNGAGVRWTFPAGNTTPPSGTTQGVDEALVLFNPSSVTVPVTATFYDNTGRVVTRQYTIAPTAHTTIAVNTLGLDPQHGVVLQSGNGQGFIAEQGITTIDARTFESSQGLAQ